MSALQHVFFFMERAPAEAAGLSPAEPDPADTDTAQPSHISQRVDGSTGSKDDGNGAVPGISPATEVALTGLKAHHNTPSIAAAMLPSILAGGQNPFGSLSIQPSLESSGIASEELAAASRILTGASTHFAANAELECAAAALKCAVAAQNASDRLAKHNVSLTVQNMADSVLQEETSLCESSKGQIAVQEEGSECLPDRGAAPREPELTHEDAELLPSSPEGTAGPNIQCMAVYSLPDLSGNPDSDKYVKSGTLSPSKTTPLSIAAAEFVPFGPAPPPSITASAAEFVPSVPARVNGPRHKPGKQRNSAKYTAFFEQRATPDRGVGLFAAKKIPVGTRILCEAPLLQIPHNDIALTWDQFCRLPESKKNIYLSLHPYAPTNLNLERNLSNKDNSAESRALQVKVMSIFSANDFILANQTALGVFETISRINHSCVPNVHFSNNAELGGKQTVHAARDIEPGEELVANYIGGRSNYQTTAERQAFLANHYGFDCKCPACSGAIAESEHRRQTLGYIVWGLNQYKYQDEETLQRNSGNPFFPAGPQAALKQAEDAFALLLSEGLITTELSKAYRFASEFALEVGQYEKALQYAFYEHNIESNIFGAEINDLKALGLASEQFIASIQQRMDDDGIPFPGPKFWANFPTKEILWYKMRTEIRLMNEKRDRKRESKKAKSLKKKLAEKELRQKEQEQSENKENVDNSESPSEASW